MNTNQMQVKRVELTTEGKLSQDIFVASGYRQASLESLLPFRPQHPLSYCKESGTASAEFGKNGGRRRV